MEVKIAVVGDEKCGKTLLCHRFQRGHEWPMTSDAVQLAAHPPRREFFFASFVDGVSRPLDDSHDTNREELDWCDVSQLSSVSLKLIEPCGANRSSLQHIIFRNVCGLIVVVDVMDLWDEFVASDRVIGNHEKHPDGLPLLGWQLFLNQTIMYWVRMAICGSNFREQYSARFPVFVVFSKTDLLLKSIGGTSSTEKRQLKRGDGSLFTIDHFFRVVSQHCCQDKTKGRLRKSVKGQPEKQQSVPWITDYETLDESISLLCEGCYFVSSIHQSNCPNSTHDVVNHMIETFVTTVQPSRKGHEPLRRLPEQRRARESCCHK